MANNQTKATAKWQEKAGYAVKSFKVKKDIAEAFTEACKANGESQASAITEFMKAYVSVSKQSK